MNEEFIVNDSEGGHVGRARLLMERERWESAEGELRRHVGAEPDDAAAHAMLALCLSEQKKFKAAVEAARTGVHLAPDMPYAHYALAAVHHAHEDLREAQTSIEEALRLDPDDADYYALLSSVHLQRRRWNEALRAAESGLYIDPEHVGCINLRALALNQLGMSDEAAVAVEGALGVEPENALTHANRGWQELHRANYEQASASFREALRIDPQLEWAREGVVEVLKSRNPVYRVMLRYFLWSSRLSGRAMWGFIFGLFLLTRIAKAAIRYRPEWGPLLWPVYIVYIVFVLLTWTASPLFDLLLRFDRLGRVALTKNQIRTTNWVGGALGVAALSFAAWWVIGFNPLLMLAGISAAMILPLGVSLGVSAPRPRKILVRFTCALAVLGLLGVFLSALDHELSLAPAGLFLLGIVAFQWTANVYTIR
jgi:tetratricopeptide (TPR) repeat protein